jgi:uncharacterized protein YdaU (DUF1376 family)
MTAARPDTWMPMFWGDYARDTGHLNAAGHGAYLMLIKHYWCTGKPLNDDDDELWRIACCDSKKEWLKLRPKIARLFHAENGELRHKRIEAELSRAAANVAKRADAGRKGAESRWQPDGNANGKRMDEPPESHWQNDGTSSSPSAVKCSEAKASAGKPAPVVAVVKSAEAEVYRVGREVLGKNAGGLITDLRKSQHFDDRAALDLIEQARAKNDPREWLGAVLRGDATAATPDHILFPPEAYRNVL